MTTCPCGIAVVDCEYHRPIHVPVQTVVSTRCLLTIRYRVVIHWDGTVSVTILP